jgi:hypothetical protein
VSSCPAIPDRYRNRTVSLFNFHFNFWNDVLTIVILAYFLIVPIFWIQFCLCFFFLWKWKAGISHIYTYPKLFFHNIPNISWELRNIKQNGQHTNVYHLVLSKESCRIYVQFKILHQNAMAWRETKSYSLLFIVVVVFHSFIIQHIITWPFFAGLTLGMSRVISGYIV